MILDDILEQPMAKSFTLKDIKKLHEDVHYYGEFGRNYLSNSDIGALLNNPREFRQSKDATIAMLQGRYFHTHLLEPQKLNEYNIVECSSRNTKIYKEFGEIG